MGNNPQNSAHRKRSLVLVTVDCLRADHCGFYGYSRPTTPSLDSLASESFVIPTAIVGGAPTYYSLPTILASRMPLALGRDVVGLAPGESTIATMLRESGYATGAFSAANPYISPRFGYHQGFDVFCDLLDFKPQPVANATIPGKSKVALPLAKLNRSIANIAGATGLGTLYNDLYFQYRMKKAPAVGSIQSLQKFPPADVLVDKALSWLASVGERPFFLWLHLMDPHSPYYPPNEAFRDLTGENIDPGRARYLNEYWNRSDVTPTALRGKRDDTVQLYDAGIRWVDRQIARLISSLMQIHLWDDCVLTLTADHGEEFLEHGGRYHAPVGLSEEIVHVPLLIRVPGERAVKVSDYPMSHLHLAPTLLEITGAQAPSSFQGRSLWMNLQRGIAWDDASIGQKTGPAIIECVDGCTNPFQKELRSASRLLAVRDARFKLVIRMQPGATEEMYDLHADPAEKHPVGNDLALSNRKRLLQAALEHIQESISSRDVVMRLRARLRDLRHHTLDTRTFGPKSSVECEVK